MNGKGFVKLRIAGQNLNFEEITQSLSQKPSCTYKKGECYTPKYGDKQPIVYKEDIWVFEVEKQENETIDNMVHNFLTNYENSIEYINKLSSNSDLTLWISVYPDDEKSNIHLGNKTLKLIADMGLVIDFDIMFLKDFYEGTYNE